MDREHPPAPCLAFPAPLAKLLQPGAEKTLENELTLKDPFHNHNAGDA
jgi:hypothetical protein